MRAGIIYFGRIGVVGAGTCFDRDRVTGGILWANLHLLFWLSLLPFITAWVGENHEAAVPTALYGVVLLMTVVAYWILGRAAVVRARQTHRAHRGP
jgi:uncharacterized membrane protein